MFRCALSWRGWKHSIEVNGFHPSNRASKPCIETIKGEEVNSPMTHSTKPYANRKSLTVAYLLLIFIGGAGAHRFYAAKTPSAVGMLVLMLIGWGLNEYTIGNILLGALAIWLLVDLFLIPGWIRDENRSRT